MTTNYISLMWQKLDSYGLNPKLSTYETGSLMYVELNGGRNWVNGRNSREVYHNLCEELSTNYGRN